MKKIITILLLVVPILAYSQTYNKVKTNQVQSTNSGEVEFLSPLKVDTAKVKAIKVEGSTNEITFYDVDYWNAKLESDDTLTKVATKRDLSLLSSLLYYSPSSKALVPFATRQPGKIYNHADNPTNTSYNIKYDGNFFSSTLNAESAILSGLTIGVDGEYQANTFNTTQNSYLFDKKITIGNFYLTDSNLCTVGYANVLISRSSGVGGDSTKLKSIYQAALDTNKLHSQIITKLNITGTAANAELLAGKDTNYIKNSWGSEPIYKADSAQIKEDIRKIQNETVPIYTYETAEMSKFETVELTKYPLLKINNIDTFEYHYLSDILSLKTIDSMLVIFSQPGRSIIIDYIRIAITQFDNSGGSVEPVVELGSTATHNNILADNTLSIPDASKVYTIDLSGTLYSLSSSIFFKIKTASDFTTINCKIIIKYSVL